MKERNQGKAKYHIIREEPRMGKMDQYIAAKNRPGYDPQRERRNFEEYGRGPSRRPHEAPCACHFCKCWDIWNETDRNEPIG